MLEKEDLLPSKILSGLYLTNINYLNSTGSLKKFKGTLKSTSHSYNDVIHDLVNDCHRNAAISEADHYISELMMSRSTYNVSISNVSDKLFDLTN